MPVEVKNYRLVMYVVFGVMYVVFGLLLMTWCLCRQEVLEEMGFRCAREGQFRRQGSLSVATDERGAINLVWVWHPLRACRLFGCHVGELTRTTACRKLSLSSMYVLYVEGRTKKAAQCTTGAAIGPKRYKRVPITTWRRFLLVWWIGNI